MGLRVPRYILKMKRDALETWPILHNMRRTAGLGNNNAEPEQVHMPVMLGRTTTLSQRPPACTN